MRVVIVEDESAERSRMKDYAEAYFAQKKLRAELLFFEDGEDFLAHCPKNPDIVLMDIDMPRLDGLSAARELRKSDSRVQLLFVTRMIQCALEGYSVDAADFLVKPIRYPVFCSTMDHVLRRIAAGQPRMLLTSCGREELCLPVGDILYIETLNRQTILHFRDGTQQYSSEPLYILEKKLWQEPFFRCHNSFLVNLGGIRSVRPSGVVTGGTEIPVSKYRKKEFLQALADYRGRML